MIEFDSKLDQIMICQQAPIKSRLEQSSKSPAASQMQAVVAAAEASLSGQMQPSVDFAQHGVAVTSISKQLADADTSMSPQKATTEQPNSPLMRSKMGFGGVTGEIHQDNK